MLRLAHTADVHLGRAFGYLGAAAGEHQARLKRAFERVFELAHQHECHAVLIAGDLFDSPRISRAWLEFALATIAGARLPTVVIPGNHDPAERNPLREVSLPSNLHYLPTTQRLTLAHLELEIVACPAGDETRWQACLHRNPNGMPLQVGLMHGSMPSAGGQGTIAPEWIAESNLDYIALGDWHSPQEWTQGRTVCWYSGAPEMIMPSQRLPAVMLLVELSPQRPAQVRPLITGEARPPSGAHEGVLVWDVSPHESMQDLLAHLQAQLTPETVVTIRLVGQWHASEPLDVAFLTERLQRRCLWVEVEATHQIEPLAPHTPFEHLLLQVADEAIARTPDQAPLYHEAIQTALYLLRGGRL